MKINKAQKDRQDTWIRNGDVLETLKGRISVYNALGNVGKPSLVFAFVNLPPMFLESSIRGWKDGDFQSVLVSTFEKIADVEVNEIW